MSHEQSETIQKPDGSWANVYGRRTPKAGEQLPGTPTYRTVDEAVKAAQERSKSMPLSGPGGVMPHEDSKMAPSDVPAGEKKDEHMD